MKRVDGRVIIDLSEEEFATLLFTLGIALGRAYHYPKHSNPTAAYLLNAINRDNPTWTPLEADAR